MLLVGLSVLRWFGVYLFFGTVSGNGELEPDVEPILLRMTVLSFSIVVLLKLSGFDRVMGICLSRRS